MPLQKSCALLKKNSLQFLTVDFVEVSVVGWGQSREGKVDGGRAGVDVAYQTPSPPGPMGAHSCRDPVPRK